MAISTRFLLLLSFLCCLRQMACAVPETVTDEIDPMYKDGSHSVATLRVKKGGALCRSLWVAIPDNEGRYPVVQFQHGYKLQNTDYTGLLTQVATWGFIVVAPQMYEFWESPDPATEISNARSILNWMKTGLIASLPDKYKHHRADFDKVALAGHSRGGHVVFNLSVTYGNVLPQKYSAIVGLDPVDTEAQHCIMEVGVPTLIVGTGLGGKFPACAPEDRGHIHFYRDLTPPSFHFVASNEGHLSFLDDGKKGYVPCQPLWPPWPFRPSQQPMRQFSAGIMVAFLQDVLFHNNTSFLAALHKKAKAPVDLLCPEWKGNVSCTAEAPREYADI